MEGDMIVVPTNRDVPCWNAGLSLSQCHQVEVPLPPWDTPASLQGVLLLCTAQGHIARAQGVWKGIGLCESGLWGTLYPIFSWASFPAGLRPASDILLERAISTPQHKHSWTNRVQTKLAALLRNS